MLPNTLVKGLDRRRLRYLLLLFFLALAVPTAVLVWQAYSQLKWEAFHQHRGIADELTRRIDTRLNDMINAADARSFADYTFLVVSGDPSANFVQRSPLSEYPVTGDLPGVLGYFQVDTDGVFSTPLLPSGGSQAANLGIGENEYTGREQLADEIKRVLADNRLVRSREVIGLRRGVATSPAEIKAMLEEDKEADEYEAGAVGELILSDSADGNAIDRADTAMSDNMPAPAEGYSQEIFDQLNEPIRDSRFYSTNASATAADDDAVEAYQAEQRRNRIGKVSDLKLNADLQKKSEEAERQVDLEQIGGRDSAFTPGRSKRREQIALPESAAPLGGEPIANVAGTTDLRISTFESEIDPFEFSLLNSGHIVVFRNVWRDGERYIQGLLVDQETFIEDVIGVRFMDTALANMSNLIVAYQDDVIHTFSGRDDARYPNVAEDLDGALLYRSRLTAPLDRVELIYSIQRLPPGPGASVLAWVTLVLAVVFAGGFLSLYRMGSSQIDLARQQQDFVSAVSHELKSPLTSIRMYGEMLKEGWADEEKRQSYYEFIHDESERLSRLISNVLHLASITRNEPQFDLKPTNVGELMNSTDSKISNQIERAGFALRFKTINDAGKATIRIDEDCFSQIIINLVDNAIKFSKNAEKKVIEIGCRRSPDSRILFSVRDYGPGIPKDQMKKIFQLFYRSESELTRETVGTGIGLAIVHQLTIAMNGNVDLINAEPGAEFRVGFSIIEP
ncbi:MAG: sensor histidine kinase [Woeseiaceae bacterium]